VRVLITGVDDDGRSCVIDDRVPSDVPFEVGWYHGRSSGRDRVESTPTAAALVTAQGIGAVVGALALTPLANRFGRRRVLVADLAVLLPATIVLYYAAPSLWTSAVALAAAGAAYIGVPSGLMTVVQLRPSGRAS
jgi:predicted MFS family arabinose efflux permease